MRVKVYTGAAGGPAPVRADIQERPDSHLAMTGREAIKVMIDV